MKMKNEISILNDIKYRIIAICNIILGKPVAYKIHVIDGSLCVNHPGGYVVLNSTFEGLKDIRLYVGEQHIR